TVVGRSLLAAVLANVVLHMVTLAALCLLARRAFRGRLEEWVFLGLTAIFPMWALWSGTVLSDPLHVCLLTLFALVWFVDRPSFWRSVGAGLLLGAAVLTRPYALLLPIAFGVAWALFRIRAFAPKSLAIMTVVC